MQTEIVSATFDHNNTARAVFVAQNRFLSGHIHKTIRIVSGYSDNIYLFCKFVKANVGFCKKQLKCRCIVEINVGE